MRNSNPRSVCAVLLGSFLAVEGAAQEPAAVAQAPAPAVTVAPAPVVAAYRRELLELANAAFLGMPLVPHKKNRSRGQMSVVDACFELQLPDLAVQIADTIPDWRRGLGHAHFALYCAKNGRKDEVGKHLAIAEQVAKAAAADPNEQSWRPARILATVARTHLALGDGEAFARYSNTLEASDAAGIQEDSALAMPESSFDAWLEQADRELAGNAFDSVMATLQTCCKLYVRFFADEQKRDALQARVTTGYQKLPRDARLKLVLEIAAHAANHGDSPRALELIHQVEVLVAEVKWHPEDEVYVRGRIANVTFRAGDSASGRAHLESAIGLYDRSAKTIHDIYRGAALRTLAEAALASGDREQALLLYTRATKAGLDNPNSRPRADDVAATCISLAQHGLEPDAELARELRSIVDGLRDPW